MAAILNLLVYKGETVTLNFGLVPSTRTLRTALAGATTVYVDNTRGFAPSGTAYILVGSTVTAITYTALTDASLTGCAAVPATPVGSLVTGGGTDITGWTIVGTFKATATDAAALLSVNATLPSGPGGIFALALTSAQTKTTLGVGVFEYDIQRTNAGSEGVLVRGTLEVLQEVLFP